MRVTDEKPVHNTDINHKKKGGRVFCGSLNDFAGEEASVF